MDPQKQSELFSSDLIAERYFQEFLIVSRSIGVTEPDLSLHLFGRTFSTPVMTAALSHLVGLREDGMVEMAKGAAQAGALVWVGMTDTAQYESIADTGASLVRIVKPYEDEAEIVSEIRQAEQLGAVAVGMDVDHIFDSYGRYSTVEERKMGPKFWNDIERLCATTRLPFIVKGILNPQEAAMCKQVGVGGIVVSHHHGLVPSAVPPLMILPEIIEQVGKEFPVFVDGSITDGISAGKALALGAKAVGVGRALLRPIKERGVQGGYQVIEKISGELRGMMARVGAANLSQLTSSVLRHIKI